MENIKWLWGVMDKRYHKWHILGLIISAVTSLMLLINPYLTMRLMSLSRRTPNRSSACC